MHTLILEDWLTVQGPGGDTITQDETHWLDLEAFQDAVFYVEWRGSTSSPTLTLQTAPTKDDTLFQPVGNATLGGASSLTAVPVILANASIPLARFVRWQLSPPGGAWNATFRILVAANSPGM